MRLTLGADKSDLHPDDPQQRQIGAGIAILVIYWILFALMISSFLRMLWTIYRHPGYIDNGPHTAEAKELQASESGSASLRRPLPRLSFPGPQLQDILSKDVFVCQPDGMPRWCTTCRIWRPDRSRHCREKDRCVYKLDHFCPWVGGIVSEQSMKFFILFNGYTFVYTIFDWALAAACISQRYEGRVADRHWISMLILGLFFMGLTGGIGLSAFVNALTNHTTVENAAESSGSTWYLAVRVPRGGVVAHGVRTITFPELVDTNYEELQKLLQGEKQSSHDSPRAHCEPARCQGTEAPPENRPEFAIIESDQFSNPWDLGMYENWCQIMGHNILGWFVPLHVGGPWFSSNTHVRQTSNGGAHSFFPMSLDVKILKARAGLTNATQEEVRDYEQQIERRRRSPYLLGGAGAPRVSLLLLS